MSIPQTPPNPDRVRGWVELAASVAGLAAVSWAGIRYLFRPLVRWWLRRLIEDEFKAELARNMKSAENTEVLQRGQENLWRELHELRADMATQAEHLEKLPAIERNSMLALAAAERTETAVGKLADIVGSLARDLGRVEGAVQHRDTVARSRFPDLTPEIGI